MDKRTARWLVVGAVLAAGVGAGAGAVWRIRRDQRLDLDQLGTDRVMARREVMSS
jgi:hypothetical protein